MSDFTCLYFGDRDECPNCGGSVHAVPHDLRADGELVPFPGPHVNNVEGIHGLRFCTEDCAADYEEHETAAARHRATDWCPKCGYDQHEHAPDCESLTIETTQA